jgi:hypothetical protein
MARGFQRNEPRRRGNPHAFGYSCRDADEMAQEPTETATLANGRPSILRCIWRGMYKVRTREGDAAEMGLHSSELRTIVHRYTQEGRRSIYRVLNSLLRRGKGKDLREGTNSRTWVIKLVMAVRLLWSEEEGPEKVYRGMPSVNLGVYERAMSSGRAVQWDAFTSTSTSREVATEFAERRGNGVLFVIRRNPSHAAAADIHEYSMWPLEREVLLLPGMRFEVRNIQRKGTLTEVVLDELDDVYPIQLR